MSDGDERPTAEELWDRRYSAEDYVFGKEPNAFLAREAHRLRPGSTVLCIADGEGRNGVWLAERGHAVTAVDVSSQALAKADALAAERGVTLHFVQADLETWDWPLEAYDAVVAIFVQFAAPLKRARMFSNIAGALRRGGLLLLQGYRPEQLAYATGGPPQAENLYTSALLRSELNGLEIVTLVEHDSIIEEGRGHSGMSALIDLVATRSE